MMRELKVRGLVSLAILIWAYESTITLYQAYIDTCTRACCATTGVLKY